MRDDLPSSCMKDGGDELIISLIKRSNILC